MCLLATMSNSCAPRARNFFLGIRAVLSLPVKVFPYNLALGNALPQADISNLAISPESWELLHRDTWGSGEVCPHLATYQRTSSQPLGHTAASADFHSTSFQTGLCSSCGQHPVTLWVFQTSWKLAWGVLVLRITTPLKLKLRLGSYFETTPVSREIK